MHNSIIQISRVPIEPKWLINEDRYVENGFCPSIADGLRTMDEKERSEYLEFFLGGQAWCHYDPEAMTITIVNKDAYFLDKYERFKRTLDIVSGITFADFCKGGGKRHLVLELADDHTNRHGTYIDDRDNEFGFTTMDEFMRYAENGDVWYIGTVVDYRC